MELETEVENWVVQLRGDHPDYTEVKLKRAFSKNKEYMVVVVDADKLMECYGRGMPDYILPSVEKWKKGKAEAIKEFLNPNTGIPETAHISFETRERKRLFGILKSVREGVISFNNGRHRTIYMTWAGAKKIPVEVHVDDVKSLIEFCGGNNN